MFLRPIFQVCGGGEAYAEYEMVPFFSDGWDVGNMFSQKDAQI